MPLRAFILCLAVGTAFFLGGLRSYAQLFPPNLNCVGNLANGDVQLYWSNPSQVCGGTYSFTIWGSNTGPNGPYAVITSFTTTGETGYVHMGANGNNTTWNYYMTAECNGSASSPSDTIDNLDPVAPAITVVTVTNNQPVLSWSPSPSPETYGYIVYLVVNGNYQPIDTVFGSGNTTYTDTDNQLTGSLSYTIAAIDSCFHAGTINTSPHATIHLAATTQNCAATGAASWNAYQNWTNGVMSYRLYASYDGGPYALVDSTSALTDTFAYPAQNVCLYVEATEISTGFVSTSNVLCLTANPENPVSDLYLHTATVHQQGVNRLYYSVNPASDIIKVGIQRSENNVTFTQIQVLTAVTPVAGLIVFDDEAALTDSRSYYYRIVMTDNCGTEHISNVVKTVLLSGQAYSNYVNGLSWDEFVHELGPVVDYSLQRRTAQGWSALSLSDPLATLYEEDVQPLVGDTGTLCYVVVAKALVQLGDVSDTVETRSNELCLDQLIKIGVPNAFSPDGVNRVFRPVLRFTGNKSYRMEIYDRWGGLLFATQNFELGWDGTYNGKIVPMGAYAYFIEVVDNVGRRIERKGTVLVLR